jgi:folate-binding protein YgfZ
VSRNTEVSQFNGIAKLSHLGVIKVAGEDAAKFIHGQLTHDFLLLGPNTARLAAFCSPKGRMQASFIGFKRTQEEVLLVCSSDILTATVKRLAMFVMRAKARVTDASAEFTLRGLAGTATRDMVFGEYSNWGMRAVDDANIINLYPADGVPRQLYVAPAMGPAPMGQDLEEALWQWGEVRSAVATLTAPVVDFFVPQMLNFESVGGVNFKKGCYPGQEIVARSQFRGTLKRRAFLVHCDTSLASGMEVFGATDEAQNVGTVVQAAASPTGGFDAIISAQISAVSSETLHVSSNSGPNLTLLPLPYPLLEDV